MAGERLIRLEVEPTDECMIVSSPQFPLLQLTVEDEDEIEEIVLPVLKEMIERDTKSTVSLRLIKAYPSAGDGAAPHVPPHIIAQLAAA